MNAVVTYIFGKVMPTQSVIMADMKYAAFAAHPDWMNFDIELPM